MWIKYNPNPLGKNVGDCGIRAISKATNQDWRSSYAELSLNGAVMGDMPNANSVLGACLHKHGYRRKIIPDDCLDCYAYTVKDFCRDHPKGEFVLLLSNHIVAVKDGDFYDTWDSGNEVPIYYYEKVDEKNVQQPVRL